MNCTCKRRPASLSIGLPATGGFAQAWHNLPRHPFWHCTSRLR